VAIHEKRYRFALPYCIGKRVLDAACGTGYGTAILAEHAREVVGLDLSDEAIGYARERYGAPNVEFLVADLSNPGLEDASFDVVVSFETIEHVPDRDVYLSHLSRALRNDGIYIVSTPRVDATTESPENPFHTVEYNRADFEALLRRWFEDVELYGQRRTQTGRHRTLQRLDVLGLRKRLWFLRGLGRVVTGTTPTQDATLDDIVVAPGDTDTAEVLVAVCRRPVRS
jgi:SAM-dependent methyltransferase